MLLDLLPLFEDEETTPPVGPTITTVGPWAPSTPAPRAPVLYSETGTATVALSVRGVADVARSASGYAVLGLAAAAPAPMVARAGVGRSPLLLIALARMAHYSALPLFDL